MASTYTDRKACAETRRREKIAEELSQLIDKWGIVGFETRLTVKVMEVIFRRPGRGMWGALRYYLLRIDYSFVLNSVAVENILSWHTIPYFLKLYNYSESQGIKILKAFHIANN